MGGIILPRRFEEFSTRLTQVTMGIDAFERRHSRSGGLLDREGLVPIYLGADLVAASVYHDWSEILADLAGLDADLGQVNPASRRLFATAMLRSLHAAVTLFSGGTLSFAEKVGALVGAPIGPVDQAELALCQDTLDKLLRRQGFGRGDLAARVSAWEQANALSVQALEPTFLALMAEGKAKTRDRIFDVGDFTMALNRVHGVPYTARCAFSEGKMDLNIDIAFTRAALKHLVAHEMFPGHATQLLFTHARVVDGRSPPEVLLCTANTVLGCIQEGIADEGVELIGWVEDDNDAIHQQLRRLRSAAQTSAAWYLMVDGWTEAVVADFLRAVAAGQEAWVQGRLRLAAHPFRGPFIASYWAGAKAVRSVLAGVARKDFPAFVEYLYANAHSPQSLALFAPEAA